VEPRHNGEVKLRIAAVTAIATGVGVGIVRSRRTHLQVVATDGSSVRARRGHSRSRWVSKGRALVVLSSVRARDALGVLGGWRDGEEAADALVIEMTADLASAINERSSLAG